MVRRGPPADTCPFVTGTSGGKFVTATQEAPPISPDITVKPVNKRTRKRLPFPLSIYQTAVGKKWVMALTGIGLMGFVFFHMFGNLKMYLGPEEFDAYAAGLREILVPILPHGAFLWIMRAGLLTIFVLHLHAAYSLTIMNRRARGPKPGASKRDYIAANFASLTMRYSGILLLAFILMHLANLTFGVTALDTRFASEQVYSNVWTSLNQPWLAVLYIIGNLALGVHLFHGAWSMFQSLGVNNPRYNALRKYFAIGFTAVVIGANISFPIAVLAGVVGP
jgi:succinate dehydrogenase / fumarate reductase cytochrome b subunit